MRPDFLEYTTTLQVMTGLLPTLPRVAHETFPLHSGGVAPEVTGWARRKLK